MSPSPDAAEAAPLPHDVATLRALLLVERATAAKLAGQNEHLRAIAKEMQRALFGRRSETAANPDQLQLALEDLEQAIAEGEAEAEKSDRVRRGSASPTAPWQSRRAAEAWVAIRLLNDQSRSIDGASPADSPAAARKRKRPGERSIGSASRDGKRVLFRKATCW